ncbi:MAG: peptidoglycan DD-metalloendopeptidase family protein [Methylocystaceae bacterium]|nr:peptidoglycan DD-metalloendopeptidase family protein [Methylocystaceae bacterium]
MADNSWWNTVSTGFSNFADGVGDLFNIGSTVSPSSNMKADDVLKTKSALNAVGSYKVPEFGITDVPDTGMIDGLKTFQANNALKVDGVMNPGGPTENALGQTLAKQGISTSDLLAKVKTPNVTPKPDVPKPVSTLPQTSWSASVSFGETPKSSKPKLPKIDPMTGLSDPLANAPKGKMPTKKQWEEVAMMQQQKASSAIIPQGDTVDQRIRSMMTDKRYGDQHDTRLRDHVQKQFENAYPGKVEYDETGKMVQPTAVIRPQDVQPFDPDGELQNVSTETSASGPIMMENVTSETRPVMAASMVELDGDKKTPQDPPYQTTESSAKSKIDVERMPPPIVNPVDGGKIRGRDKWGSGDYGDSRDGGRRSHNGLDFEVKPGDDVKASVSGRVVKVGTVYGKAKNDGEPVYRTVDVETADGHIVRHFYVDSDLKVGDEVQAGKTRLGRAQDLGKRYSDITNHIHLEIRDTTVVEDENKSGYRRYKPRNPRKHLAK